MPGPNRAAPLSMLGGARPLASKALPAQRGSAGLPRFGEIKAAAFQRESNHGRLILGHWLALGFGKKWERDQTDQVHQSDPATSVAKCLQFCLRGKSSRQSQLQYAQREWTRGGYEPANVVTKARAGAAQPQRKQLRQINGKPGEKRQLTKAHDRDQHKNMPRLTEELEDHHRADERANEGKSKNRF